MTCKKEMPCKDRSEQLEANQRAHKSEKAQGMEQIMKKNDIL